MSLLVLSARAVVIEIRASPTTIVVLFDAQVGVVKVQPLCCRHRPSDATPNWRKGESLPRRTTSFPLDAGIAAYVNAVQVPVY